MSRPLPIALRAFTEKVADAAGLSKRRNRTLLRWPEIALTFDAETTTDAAQRLTFGSYRVQHLKTGRFWQEGLFHDDALPLTDPEGFECLKTYAKEHFQEDEPEAGAELWLRSRREFLNEVLWPIAQMEGLIVGFNLPFDLSRLASGWGAANRRFRGGYSLHFWKFRHKKTGKMRASWYRPTIRIKHIDSKRSFMRFTQPRLEQDNRSHGTFLESRFLDLRMFIFALTNRSHSLKSACEVFQVEHPKARVDKHGEITNEYIDYNRRDVLATAELFLKARDEFDRHPLAIDPCRTYSPASMAKAYLQAMNLTPPMKKFSNVSKEFLGYSMTAFYGGRAECRIRLRIAPVVYVDFLSMYPTVDSLMGMWKVLTAQSLEVVDVTKRVVSLFRSLSLEQCFDPFFWWNLLFFAEVDPQSGIFPVRAEYGNGGSSLNIGVNPLECSKPLWFAGPDIVASTLLSGKPPKVLRAFGLVPKGIQEGLKTVRLRGSIPITPQTDDFFRVLIEQRQRLKSAASRDAEWLDQALKVNANAGGYGIFAEMNPEDLSPKETRDGRSIRPKQCVQM